MHSKEKGRTQMNIVYLCKADPPPPQSDYPKVIEFFNSLPEYLSPRGPRNNSNHTLYFADRVSENWFPDLYDFAIVFVSELFIDDEKAMKCLAFASKSIKKLICIDLHDKLTSEQKGILKKYTDNIFSTEEGKNFLLNTFYDEDALSKQEAEELKEAIETDGYKYLDGTIKGLNNSSRKNEVMALFCYYGALFPLVGIVGFLLKNNVEFPKVMEEGDIYNFIFCCIKMVLLSGGMIALTRYIFMLGKSFMVESIRLSNRAHAIGLGKLYMQLYKNKFEWSELKDVLQNWNIDSGSAFIGLDAKDIENVSVEKIISALKSVK